MRYVMLLLLSGLSYLPALAQPEPTPTAPNFSLGPTPAVAPDTAAAIHRLFAYKRRSGIGLGAFALASGVALGYGAHTTNGFESKLAFTYASAGAGVLALVGLLSFERGYSRRREEQAIAAWQAHQLPAHLKKKLTGRYFLPTP